jgi:hypothetical protein
MTSQHTCRYKTPPPLFLSPISLFSRCPWVALRYTRTKYVEQCRIWNPSYELLQIVLNNFTLILIYSLFKHRLKYEPYGMNIMKRVVLYWITEYFYCAPSPIRVYNSVKLNESQNSIRAANVVFIIFGASSNWNHSKGFSSPSIGSHSFAVPLGFLQILMKKHNAQ